MFDSFPVTYDTGDLGSTGKKLSSLITFDSVASGVIVSGQEQSLMFSHTVDFAAVDSQIARDPDTYQLTWTATGKQTIYLARPRVDG